MRQRRYGAKDAGVADEDVELAPALVDSGSEGVDLLTVGEVQLDECGGAAEGANFIVSGEWWLAVFPGLWLMIAVFTFNLLGDGLRDIVDPRKRT